ncbi:MAG: hypothetical protein G3M70_02560 [Candidatus Nitronauta litoralis]|uniref:Uncharacterized protein n=1 Tax=Candidatus Nitronauta litoralis TaxID=2705533 RepID=A0A7T0BTP3_9BACT|nr:MAG: hypothetical protein G3M70_02560 [Candidatus Nitronauta litoralis]
MAETGDLSVQNQNINIPGLENARQVREEDVQNEEIENDRAEEARQAEIRQEDIVSVNENGPGAIEQQEIRVEGETLNVPSQDIQDNLGQNIDDRFEFSQSVADLTNAVSPVNDRAAVGQNGPENVNEAFEQAAPDPDSENVGGSGAQIEAAAEASVQQQAGAQGSLEVLEPAASQPVDEVDTGPANNPVQGGSAEGLTESDAGLAATNTGRPNANNEILRQSVEEDAEQRADQESQENSQREPESEVTNRGQNVDRLV